MSRSLGIVIGVLGSLYLFALVFLYFAQRELIYFPTPAIDIQGFEAQTLDVNDQSLRVWAARRGLGEAIIYFGGNAESPVYTAELLRSLFPEKSLYLPQYRGYGDSSGQPSEQALFADALATFDHVKQRHARVSVIGRSLGSGVATYLATQRDLDKLVLVTAFDSLESLASEAFYLFPVRWLLKDRYDSLSRAESIDVPTLFITAQNDEIVGRSHSQKLFDALKPAGAEQVIVDGADHNNLAGKREYAMALLIFLDSEKSGLREQ